MRLPRIFDDFFKVCGRKVELLKHQEATVKYLDMLHKAGVKGSISRCSSSCLNIKRYGYDAVIAAGLRGGHPQHDVTTMVLLPVLLV